MNVTINTPALTVSVGAPQVQVDVNVFGALDEGAVKTLLAGQGHLADLLTNSFQELRTAMDNDFVKLQSDMNDATNNVATRLKTLSDKVSTNMSPADVAALKTFMGSEVARLQELGADPAVPVPTEPPPATDPTSPNPGEVIVP